MTVGWVMGHAEKYKENLHQQIEFEQPSFVAQLVIRYGCTSESLRVPVPNVASKKRTKVELFGLPIGELHYEVSLMHSSHLWCVWELGTRGSGFWT